MDFNALISSNEITIGTATLRLLVAFLAGMLIGIEREAHSQPAGMRTHILITIGSTLAMLLSIYIPQSFPDFQNGDPGRIAAQVVSGIGFLGAGAILRFGINVRGLTTAASVWAMAMIGLAIGAGMYMISLISLVIILFSLSIMDTFEKRLFRNRIFKRIEITLRKKTYEISKLENILKELRIRIHSVDISKHTGDTNDRIVFYVYILEKMDIANLTETLEKTDGVVGFSVEMIS
jgi:putative Mg2+ transporter-C (MgtC) family protein